MRPILLARLDKTRPVVVLTRTVALSTLKWVTVAPVTSTIRGLRTEVSVGRANGLDHDSAVSLDNIATVPVTALGREIGRLLPGQELQLTEAIHAAFDLE